MSFAVHGVCSRGVEEWEAESEGGAGQLQCILSGQEAECVTFGVRFTR